MDLLRFLHRPPPRPEAQPWTLVGVGDPLAVALEERRNLGRHMLVRWASEHEAIDPPVTGRAGGSLYTVLPGLQVFMPEVPVHQLGHACKALLKEGMTPSRLILVATDLRLPLGHGRLRLSGPADHPGVRSVIECLGTQAVARLVFGVGPMVGPRETYLAERWPEAQWERLKDLDEAFAQFLELLRAAESLPDMAVKINGPGFWPWDHRRPGME